MWIPPEVHLTVLASVGVSAPSWICGIITKHRRVKEHINLKQQQEKQVMTQKKNQEGNR
jgi:hypothetical protein